MKKLVEEGREGREREVGKIGKRGHRSWVGGRTRLTLLLNPKQIQNKIPTHKDRRGPFSWRGFTRRHS